MRTRTLRAWLILGGALLVGVLLAAVAVAQTASTFFTMVRSESAIDQGADCLQGASANVTVRTVGGNQIMDVNLRNAAPNTGFTLFVIQQPNAPFGVSWYQGDLDTDNQGNGSVQVKGIFSEETFAFAPESVPAPQVDAQDAARNPAFDPVHTLHLGLWFADPQEAQAAGCSGTVTPFDGDHEAGIQALSTRNFPDLGPLSRIQ
ncbi:MAG: hypothetical protein M3324_01460 [Actinomycetota bacterium]|nr:hypothetical protein [Actinomycetota bacterium]